jgi:hypothetical protein
MKINRISSEVIVCSKDPENYHINMDEDAHKKYQNSST